MSEGALTLTLSRRERGQGPLPIMQPTAYQYVKLGSNLEFLRGISTVSVMQTTSLAACPNLMDNFARGVTRWPRW